MSAESFRAAAGGPTARPGCAAAHHARPAGLLLAILMVVLIAGPRAAPVVLPVAAILAAALMAADGVPVSRWLRLEGFGLAALAFALYCLLASLWAPDIGVALGEAWPFALNIGLGLLVVGWLWRERDERLSRLALGLLVAVVLGLGYLLIEILSGQAIKIALFNHVDLFRPETNKHFVTRGGVIRGIGLYHLNRNVAVAMLLLWPGLLLALLAGAALAARLMIALVLAVAVIVVGSAHESSKVALVASLIGFGFCRLAPTWAWRALRAAWVITVVCVVPLVLLAHAGKLQHADWMQDSARARIVLWNHTAELALQRPLLGWGVAAARVLDARDKAGAAQEAGVPYAERTGQHAHNLFLQTWFELGAVGVLLLLALGWMALGTIEALPHPAGPYAYATFVAAMAIAGLSWGMWQAWYLPALLLAGAVPLVLAVRAKQERALDRFAGGPERSG